MAKILTMILLTVAVILVLVLAAVGDSEAGEQQFRRLAVKDYVDKMKAGWVGQAIGVLWGQWTEGRWSDTMVPFDLEDWYRMKKPGKEFTDKAPKGI